MGEVDFLMTIGFWILAIEMVFCSVPPNKNWITFTINVIYAIKEMKHQWC